MIQQQSRMLQGPQRGRVTDAFGASRDPAEGSLTVSRAEVDVEGRSIRFAYEEKARSAAGPQPHRVPLHSGKDHSGWLLDFLPREQHFHC